MKEAISKMKQCCDKVYKDDGRQTDGRKGDWGSHTRADNHATIMSKIMPQRIKMRRKIDDNRRNYA